MINPPVLTVIPMAEPTMTLTEPPLSMAPPLIKPPSQTCARPPPATVSARAAPETISWPPEERMDPLVNPPISDTSTAPEPVRSVRLASPPLERKTWPAVTWADTRTPPLST
jgi:hypothetical protein